MVASALTAAVSRILVVEDEPAIREIIKTALSYQGHTVTEAPSGASGLELALNQPCELIVLDVMLPGIDGFEICTRLRDAGRTTPVLFLTARDEHDDRIRGFTTGGDDYLTKPFSVDELVLRVAAILRRTGHEAPENALVFEDLVLDPNAHEVRRQGETIDLSPTEFNLLHYLMINAGTVVSKAQILVSVWDEDYEGSENVVELYIGYLRRKVDKDRNPLIHTKRGVGYVMRSDY